MNYVNKMPLTDTQMGIYLECAENESALQYNITFEYIFAGDTDAEKLKAACEKVLGNYAVFSSGVKVIDGIPSLVQIEGNTPSVTFKEVSGKEYSEIRSSFTKPFRFNGEPLCRMAVYITDKNVYLLYDIHHLIYDGVSTNIFDNALEQAYLGKELQKEQISAFDAAELEKAEINQLKISDSYKFFDTMLNGVETDSNLIPDLAGEDISHCSSLHYDMEISRDSLNDFAKNCGVTENVVLLSAFSYALAKYTGQNEALFTSVNSGRRGKPLDNTMGFFVRTFPLYFQIDEESAIKDYVNQIKASYFDVMCHSDASFAELASRYGIRSDVKYVYQGDLINDFLFDGRKVEKNLFDCDDALSNLDVMITGCENGFHLRMDYRNGLYSEGNVLAFARLYSKTVRGFLSCTCLKEIPLVDEEDKEFIDSVNATERPYDESETVWSILSGNIAGNRDALAVSCNGREISYGGFDRLTAKLAAEINARNLGKEDFVSVLVPRNEYMAICAWGAVRAGCAYQPLDPSYPKERLNFMVSDCGAKLLIAERSLRPLLAEYRGDVIYTDEIESLPEAEAVPLDSRGSALVIIYTSGTTGVPKGCVLENRNVVCFHHNHTSVMGINASSRVATYASFGFDAGVMDVFTTLMSGASLYVIPDEIRLDVRAMNEFYKANGITHGFMTTQVGSMFAKCTDCESLEAFLVGGEKLVPFNPPEDFSFINGYGPSETLAYVCHYRVKNASSVQPVGRPHSNTKLYIADRYMRLLPAGACGELCIAGGQVGRGYFMRPEKTAEVFVDNPFCNAKGYERLYKTGDLARLLPDGNVDFAGRRDGQVKIRGFRVELSEVEQIIREFEGIENATVQAFDSSAGGKYIAAYIVSANEVDIDSLKAFIAEKKPAYMVPEVIMQVDSIPLNANGKVDRRRLPEAVRKTENTDRPENEIQQRIYDKAAEVLGNSDFGIGTCLFNAGLSSIGVIKFNISLAEEFGISLSINDLRENDTVLKLEKFIMSTVKAENAMPEEDYPLSKTQEGIYIECISNPGTTTYNIPLLLKISSSLDEDRLKKAIVKAVEAHGYIKTRLFTNTEGKVRQARRDGDSFTESDIENITAATIDDVKPCLMKPYDLLTDRLFRFAIIHAGGLYLYADMHHIIGDGTSVKILMEDIAKAYRGEELTKESFSGFDVAEAEELRRKPENIARAKRHYDRFFGEADGDCLPAGDFYRDSSRGSGYFELESKTGRASAAEEFCKKNRLGMNGLVLSAFGYVLAEYNAEESSVFTTIYNGRNDSRTAGTVAMLVKTLPVYVSAANAAPAKLVSEVSDQILDSMVNDTYSFAEISREYGISSDIMVIYQGDDFGFDSFCNEKAEEIPLDMNDKKSPLSIQVFRNGSGFVYKTDYDNGRYSEELVRSIVRAFDRAIGEFISCESLADVALADAEAIAKMDGYNETEAEFDETRTMSSWFEETAEKYPDNIAVVCEDRKLKYSELEDLSGRVAAFLNDKGIGRGSFVSVLVERNEFMAVGALGVIRSGAACEPLDPAYPEERIRFMMEDAGVNLVIADRKLAHILKGTDVEILYTDEIDGLPKAEGYKSPATPDDRFVIIYTSGTTGVPKGNVLAHRNPVSLFSYHIKDAELGPDSRTAYYTGFSFDAGMLDLYASLLSGGTLYIITEEMRLELGAIDRFFCDNGITHSSMTTQMGSLFVRMTGCKTLRYFTVGGEKLVPFTPPEHIRFVNGYGPSECTIYSSGYDVKNDALLQPIGKPLENMKFYILDRNGHRLPFGAAGELCIAGKQVGLGYLNRPEKNAEVFTDNPFTDEKGYGRLYHTGDVVRELTDGNYDFVGRKDGQVKIRGFRVELSEVEQCIRNYPGIENATVQAFDDPAGGKFIAAYVVSQGKIDFNALSSFIGETKPSYMIPAAFAQLERIPLTANGKIDKRALPAPERKNENKGAEPANETEKAFCDIFCQTLGLEKVYADDDFFNIGGSSITAAQAVVKCDAAGFNIVFKNLFENPTPQKLASFVSGNVKDDILAPTGAEKEKYDYSCLDYNVPANLPNIRNEGIGDVLLTGVTGFLGSHVYKALIEMTDGNVICLARSKSGMTAQERFQMIMAYYFEDWYDEKYDARTVIIDGDLDDADIDEKLRDLHFDTIINNAANVKHFDKADNLVKDNFESVEHLISLAEKRNAKLIQASSLSVCGESVNGSIPMDFKFREFNLNIGQSLENKYVYSKYLAEQAIIDAVSRGRIRGKIMRFGNLSARETDGEYQINASNSGLLKLIQGYIKLGCYPVDMMDAGIEFSPIDKVAEAMILLAGTPDEFTVFHAKNCHEIHYGYFINALRAKGHKIDIVEREEFEERFKRALEEEDDITDFTGFIAYLNRTDASVTDLMVYNNDESNSKEAVQQKTYETRVKVSSDTSYTVKALYRLGFSWPLTSTNYLESMVNMLDEKDFF